MKKLLVLIITLIITEKIMAQCRDPRFKPAIIVNFTETIGGPGADISIGAWGKPIGLVAGFKTYTVQRTKTKAQDNVLVPFISFTSKIIIAEKFFLSPYATIGNGGYKEVGVRPAYIFIEQAAFTATVNWNTANNGFGFAVGVIKVFLKKND